MSEPRIFWKMLAYSVVVIVAAILLFWLSALAFIEESHRAAVLPAFRTAAILVGCLGLIASLIFARFVTRRVTLPLGQLEESVRRASKGDYNAPVVGGTPLPGIERLAEAVEGMRSLLKGSIDAERADRQRLGSILASMQDGVIALDHGSRILEVNRIASVLLGIGPNDLGRPLGEVVRNPQFLQLFKLGKDAHASGETETTASPPRILNLLVSPLKIAGESEPGVVFVVQDVTELRRLETVRRDFIANVSHEIKTPLTAIKGYVETVLDDAEMPPAITKTFLEKISSNAERLMGLTNDVLTLARVEAYDDEEQSERYRPDDYVRNAASALEDKARAKEHTLEILMDAAGAEVLGDAKSLEQALYNLIDNAINYTPNGGHIRVSSGIEGENYVTAVTDNGIGVPEPEVNRIFERFYRVDKARSKHAGGTGLGLAIVRHISVMHGGSVEIESVPGKGSTFRMVIPLAEHEARRRAATRSSRYPRADVPMIRPRPLRTPLR